jgi:hypothetical protein
VRYRDRARETEEARRAGAAAAAQKLLHEVARAAEDDAPLPPTPVAQPWETHWRAYAVTTQEGTMTRDPLFDGMTGDGRPLRRIA